MSKGFDEPYDDIEWQAIGADLRIQIRKQFYKLETELAELREQVKYYEAALEFYGDRDNWQDPDNFVPYWTIWEDGNNIEGQKAREVLSKYKEGK